MVQSGEYVLSPELVSTYKKVDLKEAETIWNVLFNPRDTTLDMIHCLVFNLMSINRRQRYYIPTTFTVDSDNDDSGPTNVATPTVSTEGIPPYQTMLQTIRSAVRPPPRVAEYPTEEFVELTNDDEDISYIHDTTSKVQYIYNIQFDFRN